MTHILVVDDDAVIRTFLSTALSARGFDVRLASNGREAIAALNAAPVELVLIDIFMPEMDGLETIMSLRRDHPDLKLIAMSTGSRFMGRADVLSDASAFGAHAAIGKPFSMDELYTVAASIGVRTPASSNRRCA